MVRPIVSATDAQLESDAMRRAFRNDVLAGLRATPKSIPAKHIYDARGSELFEQICELDEYYLTRTERAIFEDRLEDMASAIGAHATIIEPGAGSGEKATLLLSGLDQPSTYMPIEISEAALAVAVERIDEAFPDVITQPVCADFTNLRLEEEQPRRHGDTERGSNQNRQTDSQAPSTENQEQNTGIPSVPPCLRGSTQNSRVVFFPGSTIGNFEAQDRIKLWQQFAHLVGPHGQVLIGFDLVKPIDVLIPAYDDAEGVTAEFNTNLLHRINRELAGDFDVEQFEYVARWNAALECVEMTQCSRMAQTVSVAGEDFHFGAGEHLRTERSHKFTLDRMDGEAAHASFRRAAEWTDPREWFCVALYRL